jgi:hypothetical protein
MDACGRVGAYTSVCFDDGLIHAAIEDMGGWVKLCRSTTDDLGYLQKRFCDAYKAYAGREGDVSFPPMLAGEHDLSNIAKGYGSTGPVLIGNPDRAKRVMLSGKAGPKTQITHVKQGLIGMRREGEVA